MERFLQYLDDLDDWAGALALTAERLRTVATALVFVGLGVAFQGAGILLALSRPPLALAVVALVGAAGLYRAAVNPLCRPVVPESP